MAFSFDERIQPEPEKAEYGYAIVLLDQNDVTDLIIAMAPAVTVRGVVQFETSQPDWRTVAQGCEGFPISTMQIVLATDHTSMPGPGEMVAVAPDGTFSWHIIGGPRVIRLGAGCAPWRLDRVLLDGADITNEPVDFGQTPYQTLTAAFSDAAQPLTVRVVDREGRAVPEAWVAVVSADPAHRHGWSSATLVHRANEEGRAWFPLLPADYLVVAVPRQ